MGGQRQVALDRLLGVLLLAGLLGTVIESAEQRVRATIYSVSGDQSAAVVFASADMALAYYNTTSPGFTFTIKALEELHSDGALLIQKYKNDLTALNHDILNEMADRLPGQVIEVPTVVLYPDTPVTLGQRNILNCFASELFPPAVRVTVLKNDRPLPGGVDSSQLAFDDTWRFHILKSVEIRPANGDKYSCTVEYGTSASTTAYWEPETPPDPYDAEQIAICAVGFIIGALGLIAGVYLLLYTQINEVGKALLGTGDRR